MSVIPTFVVRFIDFQFYVPKYVRAIAHTSSTNKYQLHSISLIFCNCLANLAYTGHNLKKKKHSK